LIVYIPKIEKLCLFPLKVFEGKRKMRSVLKSLKLIKQSILSTPEIIIGKLAWRI
jgi:hypothetical protein